MNSKKQFDYIEDKIRQAAEQHSPAFDEKAWEKMEVLLDKKEGKRRPLLWWIFPLLIVAGIGGYLLFKPVGDINKNTAKEQPGITVPEADAKATGPAAVKPSQDNNLSAIPSTQEPASASKAQRPSSEAPEKNSAVAVNSVPVSSSNAKHHSDRSVYTVPVKNRHTDAADQNNLSSAQQHSYAKTIKKIKGKKSIKQVGGEQDETIADNVPETKKAAERDALLTEKKINEVAKDEAATATTPLAITAEEKKKEPAATGKEKPEEEKPLPPKKEDKLREKQQRGFYVLATAGTDAGMMHLFSFSKTTIVPKYGIGLGYQVNNRFSIQTGFYISNKKYTAGAGDYKVKAGSYWDNVQINSIEAACKVYEIPLQLRVNLLNKKSFSLFGTAGMSSYIMKKEDYDCKYTAWGYNRESYWYYKGNSHLFSSLIFTAGLEKKINNKLFILVEPSFTVPLSGVGEGKVRLYSAALQTGVRYFPFVKRK